MQLFFVNEEAAVSFRHYFRPFRLALEETGTDVGNTSPYL
jgi:hypothetical protein